MPHEEIGYYRDRAEAERALAAASTNQAVAAIHAQMAELYERLIKLEAGEDSPAGIVPAVASVRRRRAA